MKPAQLPKFGLALDWETSGYSFPNFAAKHQGLSFGAIIFDFKSFEPVEELYVEIKFNDKYEWNMGAQGVHGLTREHLEANGVTQEEAALQLAGLLMKYFGTDEFPLLGHNVYFDRDFLVQLATDAGLEFKIRPRMIDSSMLGEVLFEHDRSNDLFELMGFEARGAHNALDDIRMTLAVVRRAKELFVQGLELISKDVS